MDKESKTFRMLDLYVKLCEGKTISKLEEAGRFGVDERTIQRDIDDIRAYIAERSAEGKDSRKIIYARAKRGFVLKGEVSSLMNNSEILAVCKILLESRAFSKEEISVILEKLIAGCVPKENMKLVSDLISNEKYHYVELCHKSYIQDKLWDLGSDIKGRELLEIEYNKGFKGNQRVKRIIQPAAILFSEYYFYLNAYIVEKNETTGKYEQKFDYPTIFRIDRIRSYRQMGEKFSVSYADRFEEGEFRKKVQFMLAGELNKIQFKYYGKNVESVLDRLPTANLIKETEDYQLLEAEVYGKGILMWLLSQGSNVEIIRPAAIRAEMKQMLLDTLERY